MTNAVKRQQIDTHPLGDMGLLSDQLFAPGPFLLALINPELRYVRISHRLAEILGREVGYFPGKAIVEHGFSAEHKTVMQQALETEQMQVLQNWTVAAARHEPKTPGFWEWIVVPLHDHRQRVYGLLLSGRDVTERRLLESDVIGAAQERRELGLEIHEHISQLLAALTMKAKALEFLLLEESSDGVPMAREFRELTTEAVGALRRIARRLCPVNAAQGGLISGLMHLAEETVELYHVSCRIFAPDQELDIEPVQAIHVHAIVQQAIQHAVQQAGAENLTVDVMEEPGCYTAKMTHDGKAYRRLGVIQGYRLMTFHAHTIGGTLSVEGRTGAPVTFTGRFPKKVQNDG